MRRRVEVRAPVDFRAGRLAGGRRFPRPAGGFAGAGCSSLPIISACDGSEASDSDPGSGLDRVDIAGYLFRSGSASTISRKSSTLLFPRRGRRCSRSLSLCSAEPGNTRTCPRRSRSSLKIPFALTPRAGTPSPCANPHLCSSNVGSIAAEILLQLTHVHRPSRRCVARPKMSRVSQRVCWTCSGSSAAGTGGAGAARPGRARIPPVPCLAVAVTEIRDRRRLGAVRASRPRPPSCCGPNASA